MSAIYDLMSVKSEYEVKMNHAIPKAEVTDRVHFLLDAARGRNVLDIGASGPMSEALKQAANVYHGLNITDADYCIDIDQASEFPTVEGLELVIAGEVIEHLSNAGHFLDLLHRYVCPIILTTPNAFSEFGRWSILRGIEQVNPEHVAYYSYHTLGELIRRHGFRLLDWYWYHGNPYIAEGLIFCMEAV